MKHRRGKINALRRQMGLSKTALIGTPCGLYRCGLLVLGGLAEFASLVVHLEPCTSGSTDTAVKHEMGVCGLCLPRAHCPCPWEQYPNFLLGNHPCFPLHMVQVGPTHPVTMAGTCQPSMHPLPTGMASGLAGLSTDPGESWVLYVGLS